MRESLGANETRGQGMTISLLIWIDYHAGFHMLIIALKLEQLEAFEGGFSADALRHLWGSKARIAPYLRYLESSDFGGF